MASTVLEETSKLQEERGEGGGRRGRRGMDKQGKQKKGMEGGKREGGMMEGGEEGRNTNKC